MQESSKLKIELLKPMASLELCERVQVRFQANLQPRKAARTQAAYRILASNELTHGKLIYSLQEHSQHRVGGSDKRADSFGIASLSFTG